MAEGVYIPIPSTLLHDQSSTLVPRLGFIVLAYKRNFKAKFAHTCPNMLEYNFGKIRQNGRGSTQ